MPCWTIETSKVNLKVTFENKKLLVAALEALNYSVAEYRGIVSFTTTEGVTGTLRNDELQLEGEKSAVKRFDVNKLKRAYSREVVMEAVNEFNWGVEETTQPGEVGFSFELEKESF